MRCSYWPVGTALALLVSSCAVSHRMHLISPCNPPPSAFDLTWFGPSDPPERDSNAAWCRMVGSSVAKPRPSAQFDDPEARDSLAVFSWNIDVGAGDLLSFLEKEVELSCGGTESTAGARFPHFVVLVQEAFRRTTDLPPLDDQGLAARKSRHDPHPRGDPDIVDVADLCGLALLYIPSGRNGVDAPGETVLDKGNAILSSLPLSSFLAVEHPFETERKVTIAATVPTAESGSLRVVNSHMEVTTSFHRVLLTGNQTRLRQANGLIEALEIHEREEGSSPPTVMGGDFNTWSGGESALKRLWLAFPDSPAWDRQTTRGPFPTDHLFFRKGAEGNHAVGMATVLVAESYRRLDHRYSSDHRGRFAWVRFGQESAGR